MKVIYLMNDFEAQGFLLVGFFWGGCRCQLLFVPLDLYYAPLKILHMESKNGDLLEDDVHF